MTDAEKIKIQFAGAGYNTKRGVLNLQFDDAKIAKMSEEQLDAHIVGVIMSQQYSLKKGIELFGERGDAAVEKELTQIHEMEAYEPLMASELTWQDKRMP